ncbi:bile acid:sodium symporter family protein [Mailhella massiliensis]|uniref:bile acid:sodium symporter family protein n=1 Tax=Mailhella massiliensis TaxID=1903261 RepID=UPI0023F3B301|nr:bile acid:sodium symporter family protein [Mailhella massiliensis]
MQTFRRVSAWLSRKIGFIILAFSLAACLFPGLFSWAVAHTSLFLAVIMFGMGLTIRMEDFRAVFVRPRALAAGCAAQFTVMPLLAYALARFFDLPADLALGVILVGCCPGGTASNVITYLACGDVALSVGMTAASTLIAPLLTPMLVYVLAGSWVQVSFWAMVLSVVKIVLLPVAAGIALRRSAGRAVDAVADVCPLVSVAGIVLIVSGIIAVNAEKIAGSGALVLLLVFLHNGAGLFLGLAAARLLGLDYAKATAVSIEVGMQNSGLAVALAAANFAANPLATLPGALFSAWQNITGSLFASWRRKGRQKEVEAPRA